MKLLRMRKNGLRIWKTNAPTLLAKNIPLGKGILNIKTVVAFLVVVHPIAIGFEFILKSSIRRNLVIPSRI